MKFYKFIKVGRGILENALQSLRRELEGRKFIVFTGKEKSLTYGVLAADVLKGKLFTDYDEVEGKWDVVVGVGGGTVIDRAKLWAYERKLPFISVPTLASSDGIASPVSVLNGKSLFLSLPYGVLVDLKVIESAPRWSLLAGIGDLISNISASLDWDRFRHRSYELYSAEASAMARLGAVSFLNSKDVSVLVWGLIMSGLAMEFASSSRPASGPEHKISHALDSVKYGQKHGIQVGIFTPLFLKLNGYREWEKVRDFLISSGLPPHVELDELTAVEVFSRASSTRPHRYTVLEELGWEKALDEALKEGFVKLI